MPMMDDINGLIIRYKNYNTTKTLFLTKYNDIAERIRNNSLWNQYESFTSCNKHFFPDFVIDIDLNALK